MKSIKYLQKTPISMLLSALLCFSIVSTKAVENKTHDINEKPWNFLVIVVDDLGFMDIEPNNPDSFYQTPNLTKLAQQSVNFTNSYAANPVCSPSRVALMTGVNPARLKATDWFHHKNGKRLTGHYQVANSIDYLPKEALTIAEALPKSYQKTFIGKWHLGEDEKLWPENQGFDTNIAGWAAGSPKGGYFAPYSNPRLVQGEKGEHLTQRLTNEAINTLKSAADKPFLLVLSYYSVHVPLQAPQHSIEKYQQLTRTLTEQQEFGQEEQVLPQLQTVRKVRKVQNQPAYAAMVEQMDSNVGRVLAQLEQAGLANNTVVIFTSDNGGLATSEGLPTSNLPLRGGKGWIYEGGIKVPLMIKVPGMSKANTMQSTPVIGMDIPATIYHLTDTKVVNLDGQSLLPLLLDENATIERPLFWHYPHYSNQGGLPASAVRLGKYKLIQRLETGAVQLYDLDKDLGEKNDISAQKPEKVTELYRLLLQWYQEVDAQFLKEKSSNKKPWQPKF
ncbi:sulfatase [Thalassotalea fonticola]|uniref:Sulfatase n=1 Tax=Thalassotalea fonticola TaxID=3065649 RepID=A0ABZ0GK54_9GAMM|nr:sulfatase [Colwelliaceae bacterium S1-1]